MKTVFLVGFMGSGKTTLGTWLAKELDVPFCDLDRLVEERQKRSITEIYEDYGDAGFHHMERKRLHEVAKSPEPKIVACGGATPLYYDNMEYMRSKGVTLYLKCSFDTLLRRLTEAQDERPLIAGKEQPQLVNFITLEMARREPTYLKAHFTIDSNKLESEEQITETIAQVRKKLRI